MAWVVGAGGLGCLAESFWPRIASSVAHCAVHSLLVEMVLARHEQAAGGCSQGMVLKILPVREADGRGPDRCGIYKGGAADSFVCGNQSFFVLAL